jgi:hypothetical protein
MNNKQVYEYAILRVVPNVAKEEFVNVGVILYSRHLKFIGILTQLHTAKLLALDAQIDLTLIATYIQSTEKIVSGTCDKKGIAGMEPHERFRWVTANRSTIIQTSSIHTGITSDASKTLQLLFEKYVQ